MLMTFLKLMFLDEIVIAEQIENNAVVGTVLIWRRSVEFVSGRRKQSFLLLKKNPTVFSIYEKPRSQKNLILGNRSLMRCIPHMKAKLYFSSDLRRQRDIVHHPAYLRTVAPTDRDSVLVPPCCHPASGFPQLQV